MKKFLLSVILTVFTLSQIAAQGAFKTGDLVANLGVGFGWYSYAFGATSLPAFSLSLEKGLKEVQNIGPLSIGGIVGYKHASYAYSSIYDYGWNDIIIAARGALHYDLFKSSKVDTYGGVALGVRLQNYSYFIYNLNGVGEKAHTNYTHGLFALYLGGRYFFSEKVAAFGELGYGLGYLTLGLSFKI